MYKVVIKFPDKDIVQFFSGKTECDAWISQSVTKKVWGDPEKYTITITRDLQEEVDDKFKEFRENRDKILKSLDWTQLSDTLIKKQKLKRIYREYREYLRNLPNNYNATSIFKYSIITFKEFLKLKVYIEGKDYER